MKTIWLVASGTGGHIFPAFALAEELRQRGLKPVLTGRSPSWEQQLALSSGFPFQPLSASGFLGKSHFARLGFVSSMPQRVLGALAIMQRIQPELVVAAGGFAAVAPLTAARILKRPYFLLEQNRIPGRVTRYFSRTAQAVFLTFPSLVRLPGREVVTGTPLRRSILSVVRRDDGRTLLVLGGSLGAHALNTAALEIARQLPNIRLIVQTGKRDYPLMQEQVRAAGLTNIELIDFTLAMDQLYARASLILTRAGGMVINEILALGIPSILVPFPFATDNHQSANALHVASLGAAIHLDQSRLSECTNLIRALLTNPRKLLEISTRARSLAFRDATETIANHIVDYLATGRLRCSEN